jgi:hypothetical protein
MNLVTPEVSRKLRPEFLNLPPGYTAADVRTEVKKMAGRIHYILCFVRLRCRVTITTNVENYLFQIFP